MNKRILKINLGIFGLYILITIIATFPSVLGLIRPYTILGGAYDSPQMLWFIWWEKNAILNLGTSPTFTPAIFHPLGGVLFIQAPFNEFSSVILQPILGLTQTYTFLMLFTFPTAAFNTYLLGYYFTRNRWAAFIGGLIFSFSTHHYVHASEHLHISTIQWLPLYALALFLIIKKPSLNRTAFLTVSFILAVGSDHVYYMTYFVAPVTILFLLYYWFTPNHELRQPRLLARVLGAIFVGFLFVLPIYPHLVLNRDNVIKYGNYIEKSAYVSTYLLPAKTHPVWGTVLRPLYEQMEISGREGYVFIGWVALFLAAYAVIRHRNRITKFWLILGVLAFIFSLGPALNIFGPVKIVVDNIESLIIMPYALIMNIPLIGALRAPARLSETVQLSTAILATYGLAAISVHWSSIWRTVVFFALGTFILFETVEHYPYPIESERFIPPVIYQQLAKEDNQLAVLEIPSRKPEGDLVPTKPLRGDTHYYMYYSTIHEHPLVGGEAARNPITPSNFIDTTPFIRELMYPDEFIASESTVLETDTDTLIKHGPELLAKHDIGYVVVHRDLMAKYFDDTAKLIPEQILAQSLGNPFHKDEEIIGFRVPQDSRSTVPEQEAILWGDGWFPEGKKIQGHAVRWIGQSGSLIIYQPESIAKRLSITAFSPMSNDVEVTVMANDMPVNTFQVGPDINTSQANLTHPIQLQAGINEIKLEAHPVGTPTEKLDYRMNLGVSSISLMPTLKITDTAPTKPNQVNLSDKLEFIGYDQSNDILKPGTSLNLTLYWHALQSMDESYKVFIHVLDNQGNIIMQQDSIPQNWALPTTVWGIGEVVEDKYSLEIPQGTLPGQYQVSIGMYSSESLQRLNVKTKDNAIVADSFRLAPIYIE